MLRFKNDYNDCIKDVNERTILVHIVKLKSNLKVIIRRIWLSGYII